MVEGGPKCVKYLVFIFNLLFFFTGGGLIAIGVWLNVDRTDWKGISDYDYISVANVIIAAGAVIVIVAFLGCCGAITENKTLLMIFFTTLLLIFCLETGAGIAAYVWRGELEDELRKQIEKRIPERYYKESGVETAMNAIQKEFDCCGVDSITDWGVSAQDSSGEPQMKIDASCCIINKDKTGYDASCKTRKYSDVVNTATARQYNQQGCYQSIKNFLQDNLLYVGICGIIFAVFQIIGMVLSLVLYRAIRKEGQVV